MDSHRPVKNSDKQVGLGDHNVLIDLDDTSMASKHDVVSKASIYDMNDFISASSIQSTISNISNADLDTRPKISQPTAQEKSFKKYKVISDDLSTAFDVSDLGKCNSYKQEVTHQSVDVQSKGLEQMQSSIHNLTEEMTRMAMAMESLVTSFRMKATLEPPAVITSPLSSAAPLATGTFTQAMPMNLQPPSLATATGQHPTITTLSSTVILKIRPNFSVY